MKHFSLLFLLFLLVSCGSKKLKTQSERSKLEQMDLSIEEKGIIHSQTNTSQVDNSITNFRVVPKDVSSPIRLIHGKDTLDLDNAILEVETKSDIQTKSETNTSQESKKETQKQTITEEKERTKTKEKKDNRPIRLIGLLILTIIVLILYRRRY